MILPSRVHKKTLEHYIDSIVMTIDVLECSIIEVIKDVLECSIIEVSIIVRYKKNLIQI